MQDLVFNLSRQDIYVQFLSLKTLYFKQFGAPIASATKSPQTWDAAL